ncbi:MAG: NUDIX hydrolase [Lutibacter sp.]
MYKVFINDRPIILTDKENNASNYDCLKFNQNEVLNYVSKLFKNEIPGICFLSDNLMNDWELFCNLFKIQKAAGGKLINENNHVLFINRFNKWDLPKGKLEKNETLEQCAKREVIEECGNLNLNIIKQLQTTYHIFKRNNKLILKITYWFLMKTQPPYKLKPQTEEGITQVVFKNSIETKKALQNTYSNIQLLF